MHIKISRSKSAIEEQIIGYFSKMEIITLENNLRGNAIYEVGTLAGTFNCGNTISANNQELSKNILPSADKQLAVPGENTYL